MFFAENKLLLRKTSCCFTESSCCGGTCCCFFHFIFNFHFKNWLKLILIFFGGRDFLPAVSPGCCCSKKKISIQRALWFNTMPLMVRGEKPHCFSSCAPVKTFPFQLDSTLCWDWRTGSKKNGFGSLVFSIRCGIFARFQKPELIT